MSKINTSPSPAKAAADLGRELSTAMIAFQDAVARKLGMSAPERKTLGVLNEMKVATPSQLAQATGLTTGAITGIVDRLEKAGYAKRAPNPDDRRSLLIHIQREDELAESMTPVFASLGVAMMQLGSRYSAQELEVIQTYLRETITILKAETDQIKT